MSKQLATTVVFRGKPTKEATENPDLRDQIKDGWVYGNLIWNGGDPWIVGDIADWDDEYIVHDWWVNVIPETVGMFTGLTADFSDDAKIFEGDIVAIYSYSSYTNPGSLYEIGRGAVMFHDGAFWAWDGMRMWGISQRKSMMLIIGLIGSIHDIPKIIEEAKGMVDEFYDTRAEKLAVIIDMATTRVQDESEICTYRCTVCGKEFDDDPDRALRHCRDDCAEDIEDMAHDFRYDQLNEEGF